MKIVRALRWLSLFRGAVLAPDLWRRARTEVTVIANAPIIVGLAQWANPVRALEVLDQPANGGANAVSVNVPILFIRISGCQPDGGSCAVCTTRTSASLPPGDPGLNSRKTSPSNGSLSGLTAACSASASGSGRWRRSTHAASHGPSTITGPAALNSWSVLQCTQLPVAASAPPP